MSGHTPFYGQWFGTVLDTAGVAEAGLILNIDRDRPNQGIARIDYNDPLMTMHAWAEISQVDASVEAKLSKFTSPSVPEGVTIPSSAKFSGQIVNKVLNGQWQTDVTTSGAVAIVQDAAAPGQPDNTISWAEFVSTALKADPGGQLIYRGQDDSSHALTTAFHRRKRYDLIRYASEDVKALGRSLESTLSRQIDTDRELAWLLSIAQHHGFPTPLQDWTESPFVAAFFAFSTLPKDPDKLVDRAVRIFAFDRYGWPAKYGTVSSIDDTRPLFAPFVIGTAHNPRALPQQSVHMWSTMVDIERFVGNTEQNTGRRYLTRVDVPASERSVAMRDLRRMGITAASMFPGLDGICRALGEQFF